MQEVSSLPSGASAPNTVIIAWAVTKLHLHPMLQSWLIQTPSPLTATQINAARQMAPSYGVQVETKSSQLAMSQIADGATALGIIVAIGGALGLLGAVTGMAGAVITGLAWARSSLSVTFGDVPLTDILILLAGLPLAAAIGGWLLAGREPTVISRQPLE